MTINEGFHARRSYLLGRGWEEGDDAGDSVEFLKGKHGISLHKKGHGWDHYTTEGGSYKDGYFHRGGKDSVSTSDLKKVEPMLKEDNTVQEGAISGAIAGAALAGKGHRISGAIAGAALGHLAKKAENNPEFKGKIVKGLGHAANIASRFAEEREENVVAILDAAVEDNAQRIKDVVFTDLRSRVMDEMEALRPTVWDTEVSEETDQEDGEEIPFELDEAGPHYGSVSLLPVTDGRIHPDHPEKNWLHQDWAGDNNSHYTIMQHMGTGRHIVVGGYGREPSTKTGQNIVAHHDQTGRNLGAFRAVESHPIDQFKEKATIRKSMPLYVYK